MSSEKSQSGSPPVEDQSVEWLKQTIRDIPDFPKPGIVFKDLTTLLKDARALACVLDRMSERASRLKPDYVAAIEARGFILGPSMAANLGVGFVPIRKPGKLPHAVEKETYDLEYGKDAIEVHRDAVEPGSRVVLVDDLLATGGTALAGYKLLKRLGADVTGIGFVVELSFLNGRQKLPEHIDVFSLIAYS